MNKKLIYYSGVLVLLVALLTSPPVVNAAAITGIVYSSSGATVGTFLAANNDLTVFTPETKLATVPPVVTLTFPAGTALTGFNIAAGDFTIQQADNGELGCLDGVATAPTGVVVNEGNRTIALTVSLVSVSNSCNAEENDGLGVVTVRLAAGAGDNEIQDSTTATTTGVFRIDTESVWGADTGQIATVTFVPDILGGFLVNAPATGVVGANVSVTITGVDSYNNTTVIGYGAGAVDLTVDLGTVAPTSVAQAQFTDDGIWTGNVQFNTSGNITLTATGNTEFGDDILAVSPAAINNLACLGSGAPGSVYISWTVPLGTSAGYSAKRSLSAITTNGEFNAATDIAAASQWGSGNVGQSIGSMLVTGLDPLSIYFFNVKAKGADTTLSAISTPVSMTCTSGGAASSAASTSQVSKPVSSITGPAAGASFKAETTVIVTGSSSDSGVSSVKRVEVSTDGGSTWADATPLTSNSSYGFDWKYEWTGGGEGPHLLKSRATSWTGVVETPGAGISLTVLSKSGIIYTGTSTPSTSQQAFSQITSASSVAEIQAVITTLQTQLLSLLQQLLALLTAQLGH